MLLAQEPHQVLKDVILDFPSIDLADDAVVLLVDVAVQRRARNPRNVTTIKVEWSSVRVHALAALARSSALAGCNFHFYDCTGQNPVSLLVYQHQT